MGVLNELIDVPRNLPGPPGNNLRIHYYLCNLIFAHLKYFFIVMISIRIKTRDIEFLFNNVFVSIGIPIILH